jgi:hypothetical protein
MSMKTVKSKIGSGDKCLLPDLGKRLDFIQRGARVETEKKQATAVDQIRSRSPENGSDSYRKSRQQRSGSDVGLGPNIDRVGRVLLKSVNSDRADFQRIPIGFVSR